MKRTIYMIGSLRNPDVPALANKIEELGHEAFASWHCAGPEADDYWKKHEQARGKGYRSALKGWAAKHVFEFDKFHLDRCDTGLLILPAGKSCHLELGYMAGQKKTTLIYWPDSMDPETEEFRWDVMVQFADYQCFGEVELLAALSKL